MSGLIGLSALQVALGVALVGIMLLLLGVKGERPALLRAGYGAVYTNAALLSVSTLAMVYALVTHDFGVSYVAQVGSRSTPLLFTIVSLWSALEGSILFWGVVLALYAAVVVRMNRHRAGRMVPYAAATLLVISVFFTLLLVGPANPFGVVSPVPDDGPGPNPLLQNHVLMAVHPPLLYLGYVGFSVPFAFAVGALLAGEANDDTWIRSTRLWTIAAWGFLTAAIIAGMWWSYGVLGWGGYWAWDPVENASFMPWLTATAFLHSVMVQERRGMLKVWNLNLIVVTFILTILGTFLTRSGILSSVHAFTEGTIGYYFLGFIALVLVTSLVLVAGYAGDLRSDGRLDDVVSRESVFLVNNLLLSAITFTVLLGTLFPLVAEAARGSKVTVGAPFFNMMMLPLAMALLFLVGVGPVLPWRRSNRALVRARLKLPVVALVLVGVTAAVLTRNAYAALALGFGAFAAVANLEEFWSGARARMRAHHESMGVALTRLVRGNPHRYGGYIAHLGLLAAAMGIAASSASKVENEATLRPGQTMHVNGFTVRLDRVWGQQQPSRFAVGADLTLSKGDRVLGALSPRQNFYPASDQPYPSPAVRSRPTGDIYLNLMAFSEDGSTATVRVFVEPLVGWIWLGGGLMVLGVLIALWPNARVAPEPATVRRRAAQLASARAPVLVPVAESVVTESDV